MIEFKFWNAGKNDLYVYTETCEFAKELRKEFGWGATYERNGTIFAWQFKVPNRTIGVLKTRYESVHRSSEEEKVEKLVVETQ